MPVSKEIYNTSIVPAGHVTYHASPGQHLHTSGRNGSHWGGYWRWVSRC